MKKIIKVKKEKYRDSNMRVYETGKGWIDSAPALYSSSIFEKIEHMFRHWSYGQPYCVICGKERKPDPKG